MCGICGFVSSAGWPESLLKGMNDLRSWTPTQRDEIDGLASQIITRKDIRPLRTEGKPVGYLYA